MNWNPFKKRNPHFQITLYMKSGQNIVLRNMSEFKIQTSSEGKIVKASWKWENKVSQLMDIQLDQIEAIISEKM